MGNGVEGGNTTCRLSAAEQHARYRAEQQEAARRWLLARDLHDVAEILGIVKPKQGAAR